MNEPQTIEETLQLPHLGDSNEPGYYKTEDGERVTLWEWDGESYSYNEPDYFAICSFYRDV